MASLKDTILKTRQGLATASAEELAAMQGRAPSTQPLETKVLGGTPDQAKMAGTPAQKAAALRTNIREDMDLATAVRRGPEKATATAEEQAKIEAAQRLKGLTGMQDRVQQLAEEAIQAGTQQVQRVELRANTGDVELDDLLTELRDAYLAPLPATEPAKTEAINNRAELTKQVNNYLGFTEVTNQLSAPELLSKYDVQGADQISMAFANSVSNAITTGELPLEEMGFTGVEDLAAILNMDPAALGSMSITDLSEAVNSQLQQEYSQVEELRARANDRRLGEAERAEARQQLRDLGASGIRAAESEVEKIYDEIAEATEVDVFGKKMPVEELLSDEYLSGVVAQYLDGLDPTTGVAISDFSKQLQESQPELVKFINKHKDILKRASAAVEEGVKQFAEIQTANTNLAKGVGEEPLDDAMMKALYPDWGKSTAERYEPTEFLSVLNNPQTTREQANQLVRTAKMIYGIDPALWTQLAGMDVDELRALGAMDDVAQFEKLRRKLEESNRIDQMAYPEDIFQFLGITEKDALNLADDLKMARNMGIDVPDIPGLEKDPPDWKEVFEYIKSQKATNLKDFIGEDGEVNIETIAKKLANARDAIGKIPELPGTLNQALVNDAIITRQELLDGGAENFTIEELNEIHSKYGKYLSDDARSAISQMMAVDLRGKINNQLIEAFGVGEDGVANFDRIVERTMKNTYYDAMIFDKDPETFTSEDITSLKAGMDQMDADIQSLMDVIPMIREFERDNPYAREIVDALVGTITDAIADIRTYKQGIITKFAERDKYITDPYEKTDADEKYYVRDGVDPDHEDVTNLDAIANPDNVQVVIDMTTGKTIDVKDLPEGWQSDPRYAGIGGQEGIKLASALSSIKPKGDMIGYLLEHHPDIIENADWEAYNKIINQHAWQPGQLMIGPFAWLNGMQYNEDEFNTTISNYKNDLQNGVKYLDDEEYVKQHDELITKYHKLALQEKAKQMAAVAAKDKLQELMEEFFKEEGASVEPIGEKEDVLKRTIGNLNETMSGLTLGMAPAKYLTNTEDNVNRILEKYYDKLQDLPAIKSALLNGYLTPKGFYNSLWASSTKATNLATLNKKLITAADGYAKDVQKRTETYEKWDTGLKVLLYGREGTAEEGGAIGISGDGSVKGLMDDLISQYLSELTSQYGDIETIAERRTREDEEYKARRAEAERNRANNPTPMPTLAGLLNISSEGLG